MATQTVTLSRTNAPASAGLLLPAFTLWWREIVRFYRQKSRVVGVLASPLVFWVVIGAGFGTSFRSGGGQSQHYMDYFYPGALIMIVLFTSIFTMMSVIEDRKEGFLLSVLVAPVPRSAIVLGKVLGGTTLSAIQGMIFLVFAPFAGIHLNVVQVLLVAVVVFPDFVRAYRAGLCHRVAYGFHASFPRHHQFVSDSSVAFIRSAVPHGWRVEMDSRSHVYEPAHLRSGGTALSALSGNGSYFPAVFSDGDLASVFSGNVWTRVFDGQSPHHEAGCVIAEQYAYFPALIASLNGGSAVLLFTGRSLIMRGKVAAHRACMIAAVVSSALFLACYLYFHAHVGDIRFLGSRFWHIIYLIVLIPHVTLAIVIVPMVIITLSRGLRGRYDSHRAIARWTWPLWMYVSVTGVLVYFMLYRWFPHS